MREQSSQPHKFSQKERKVAQHLSQREEMEEKDPPITACHFGGWFPKDPAAVDRYLKRLIEKVYKSSKMREVAEKESRLEILILHSSIREFKELIESDPEIFKFFNLMFTQVPGPYRQIPDYRVMLRLLNLTISMAPPYYSSELVGVPMAAIMLRPMLTPAGNNAFMNDKVHQAFKKVLNAWCVYLKSPDSKNVLDTESGWLSEDAMNYMPNFEYLYVCDPKLPHYGFKSWDEFFVREFREGVRPIAEGDNIVANACESAPLVVRRDVQLRERFWIKDQPYSLGFMLAGDPLTDNYVGGTVYQAFLSQFNYHRWHSPVDGTIVKAYNVDGSYFAECLREGYHSLSIAYSQCYITSMATRCLIFIKADNPHIGTIVFVGIGMTEVSSCDITAFEGQKVKKGEEIGMFHYGGSSHCLVFEQGVNIKFVDEPSEPDMDNLPLEVCAKLGEVIYG